MANLTLKDVKIELPEWFEKDVSNVDMVEWLEFVIGDCGHISVLNPLYDIELSDCSVSIGCASVNGKPFIIQ